MVKRRTRISGRSRGGIAVPLAVVLVTAVLGVVGYRGGELNTFICDGECSVEYILPPAELGPVKLPAVAAPRRSDGALPDKAKVAAALRAPLAQKALGTSVGLLILDQKSGEVLAQHGNTALTPASTTKLLTGYAALVALDPQARFATRVVSPKTGSIVLVGGGDPFLDSTAPKPAQYAHRATLKELAAKTAASLKRAGITTVTLGFDDSLFSGPAVNSHWPGFYVSQNIVTPIGALWADHGIVAGLRSRTPAQAAANRFATLLERQGVAVAAIPARATVADTATPVAKVESATVAQILESMIQHSDNEAAEVMARHVALARGKAGSFAAASATIADILAENTIDTTGLKLFDGSGLSRSNRISPGTLAQTVRAAASHTRTASLLSDLPLSGFNGSLKQRFASPTAAAGLGLVSAKTGTLTGVHSLAGIVRDADGRPLTFALMTDKTTAIPGLDTQAALDNVIAALAQCHCGPG